MPAATAKATPKRIAMAVEQNVYVPTCRHEETYELLLENANFSNKINTKKKIYFLAGWVRKAVNSIQTNDGVINSRLFV